MSVSAPVCGSSGNCGNCTYATLSAALWSVATSEQHKEHQREMLPDSKSWHADSQPYTKTEWQTVCGTDRHNWQACWRIQTFCCGSRLHFTPRIIKVKPHLKGCAAELAGGVADSRKCVCLCGSYCYYCCGWSRTLFSPPPPFRYDKCSPLARVNCGANLIRHKTFCHWVFTWIFIHKHTNSVRGR